MYYKENEKIIKIINLLIKYMHTHVISISTAQSTLNVLKSV